MLHISAGLTVYMCVLAGLLGACAASFLNCCAWRIVHKEPICRGRSHCDVCGHVLRARDLIPVLSFLLAGGRCCYCGAKLSKKHVAAEALGAAVFVSLLLKYDLSLQALQMLVLACVLMGASLTDLEGMMIPDRFILVGIGGGLLFPLLTPERWQNLLQAVIGGVSVSGALLLLVLASEKLTGREMMGGGDIKLLFVTGLYLGWMGNLLCLLVACVLGIGFGLYAQKKEEPIPWGPSIALSAWVCSLVGDTILEAYWGLF